MLGLPLTFMAPAMLAALAVLPAVWLLLRVTPPQPRRIDFPPLRILADLAPEREQPARTPWWLLALRLLAAALLILAVAGPVWNPGAAGGSGPLLLMVDNGVPAAHDWRRRSAYATEQAEAALRAGRAVAVLATADKPVAIAATAPAAALDRVRAVKPQPWLVGRSAHLEAITRFLGATPDAEIVWIADGVAGADDAGFASALSDAAGARMLSVIRSDEPGALGLAGLDSTAGQLVAHVVRAAPNGRDGGTLRALDLKGLPLADVPFAFKPGTTETQASFALPTEVRNAIARIEVSGENAAGAVTLVDERGRRRRIGIVSGQTADLSQPLLAPTYYIERALGPYGEIREAHGGVADAIGQLVDQQVSVLALADVGTLDRDALARVTGFVEKGGLLLRFAGTRLAAGNDDLVPVRLRRGGRNLGGALSWDAPRTLAPFTRDSPFYGLPVPADLGVRRQILAEPDGDLGRRTWAALEDGTPIVTADRRGEGLVVLFHVTADATWSNLPLSGLFVDMLRRVVAMSGRGDAVAADGRGETPSVAPTRVLDGFGTLVAPPPTARAVLRSFAERASEEHPPGFYGPAGSGLAVNALVAGDRLRPLDLGPLASRAAPLKPAETVDIRGPLLTLAILMLLLDTLASLWLGGHLARLGRPRRALAAMLALALVLPWAHPEAARAQERTAPEAALVTRLAYVLTGDAQVDATSKAGLAGLTQALASRTALEPGDPVALDLTRDELAFYALLYVPIAAGRPVPGEAAIRKLDSYMKNGGTVLFDTRDAMSVRPGGTPTAEGQTLRAMLATLDVPELEPLPRDHVLTKTFYLLDRFPGRYASGQTWVEALPPATDGERRPARAGDGVSPLLITSNDLAAAWAVGRSGEPMYPTVGGDPRQREMALRGGVNVVIYTMTGNYKADQVHVPALLERLGQ